MRALPLLQFLVRRLLTVIITLFIITAIIYAIVLMAPVESRAQLYLGKRLRNNLPEEILERHIQYIIEQHGMNDPYPVSISTGSPNWPRGTGDGARCCVLTCSMCS